MRHEDLPSRRARRPRRAVHKLETRLTPGEKSNRKRMAQVATVYSIAPFPRGAADIVHGLRDANDVDARRPRRRTSGYGQVSRSTRGRSFARLSPRRCDAIRTSTAAGRARRRRAEAAAQCEGRGATRGGQGHILLDIVHVLGMCGPPRERCLARATPRRKVGRRPAARLLTDAVAARWREPFGGGLRATRSRAHRGGAPRHRQDLRLSL